MIARIFIFFVRISPAFQKAIWRWWYQRLGKRAHDSGWTFMNYGYKYKNQKTLNLTSKDESNRMFIQLYDYVASQIPIKDGEILEVGSILDFNISSILLKLGIQSKPHIRSHRAGEGHPQIPKFIRSLQN